ncbi:hypothetical protein GCM10023186_10160 [Hymenobacter koreensis]|uniref:Uncharacterized protein n=1 Tax=Hymenobacter koreensis TaxID=1084523 RepID=A0ABP8IW40_9BACT
MDVGIKHGRHKNPATCVDDPGALGNGQAAADVLNFSFDNQNITLEKHR